MRHRRSMRNVPASRRPNLRPDQHLAWPATELSNPTRLFLIFLRSSVCPSDVFQRCARSIVRVGAATLFTLSHSVAGFHGAVPLDLFKLLTTPYDHSLSPVWINFPLTRCRYDPMLGHCFRYHLRRPQNQKFKLWTCVIFKGDYPQNKTCASRALTMGRKGCPALFYSWLAENWRRQVTHASSNNKEGILFLFQPPSPPPPICVGAWVNKWDIFHTLQGPSCVR